MGTCLMNGFGKGTASAVPLGPQEMRALAPEGPRFPGHELFMRQVLTLIPSAVRNPCRRHCILGRDASTPWLSKIPGLANAARPGAPHL